MPRPKTKLNKKELEKAKRDFKELQEFIKGKSWNDLINDKRLMPMNLDSELFDTNWKSLTCTIRKDDNKAIVSPYDVDVWVGDTYFQIFIKEE